MSGRILMHGVVLQNRMFRAGRPMFHVKHSCVKGLPSQAAGPAMFHVKHSRVIHAGTGASSAISFSRFSSAQRSLGIGASIVAMLRFTSAAVLAPGMTEQTT